jgi:hypothetical protein
MKKKERKKEDCLERECAILENEEKLSLILHLCFSLFTHKQTHTQTLENASIPSRKHPSSPFYLSTVLYHPHHHHPSILI